MSVIVQSLSSLIGMSTGQTIEGSEELVYIVGLYTSLVSAYLVKHKLQQSNIPKNHQLYLIGFIGLWIYYSIWGKSVVLPLLQVSISYLMMVMLPKEKFTRYIFVFAMSFLSMCHIHSVYTRLYNPDTNQSADFSGPLMIITQRIIALAFNVYDGMRKEEKNLDETQKKYAVLRLPSFAEYFAYMFSFTGIMCGPFVFYNDVMPVLRADYKSKPDEPVLPSSGKAVFTKAASSMLFMYLYWLGIKSFPFQLNIDETFIRNSLLLYRLAYLYVSVLFVRAKYYVAWLFADAVHNAMGIGFNGYDHDGQPKWNSVTNVNIFQIEFATGMKAFIDNWNVMTAKWLRFVCYDRVNKSRHAKFASFLTFVLSALWHGFFPGYYILFLTCHSWVLLQRKARRSVRPYFQASAMKRTFYAVTTLLFTQMGFAYLGVAFVSLDLRGSMRFYKSVWFFAHIIGFTLYFLIPSASRSAQPVTSIQNGSATENKLLSNVNNGHVKRG